MADALLSARGLSKTYGRRAGARPALVEASLDIAAGEIIGVVGESGSGKTTLARCLGLLERPSSGGVLFKGEDLTLLSPAALRSRRRAIQTVFQDPYASLNPRIRVGDAIAEVLSVHRLVPRPDIRRRVAALLDQVGLPASAGELYPADFSGGQRQRLCIARALAAEPEILIADEPVSSLDVSIRAQVLNLLLDLRQRLGLAIILIGHDLLLIGAVAPRIAVMLCGQIVELLPAGVPLAAARHPYTRELLAAVRRLEPGARIGTAPAAAPAAMAAQGCAYWSRCPHRGDPRCESQMPPLREVAPGHMVASFYDLPNHPEMRGPFVTKEAIDRPLTIVIGAPFEPELAQRIEAAMPGRLRVLHEPDLLPVPRYVADHHGIPRQLTPAERRRWLDILAEADVMLDFDWLDPASLPRNAPRLRWVQGTSAGIGEFLTNTGLIKSEITFTTAAGVHAGALAEFTILGLLYFFRGMPRLLAMQKAHQWERYTNREMAGSRLMLVGLGGVGREVARRCAAMGIEVWGARRRSGEAAPEGVSRLVALSELRQALPQVDSLVLACPLTEQTRGLIGAAEIAALKPSAIIVNIARGAVIDEAAMIDALAGGRLAGAALDVFTTEPLPPDSPLWDMPNVLFCPHSASTVMAENERIVELFVDNLRRFTEGRPLRNLFDKQRGY